MNSTNPKQPKDTVPVKTCTDTVGASSAVNPARRRLLLSAVTAASVVGAGWAAWPFVASFKPSARARAVGGTIQFNLSTVKQGEQVTLLWRGKPVWVLHRTKEMLLRLQHDHWLKQLRDPDSTVETQQPVYAKNPTRSLRPEFLVVVAVCTHLGCVPAFKPKVPDESLGDDWMGGYSCACHGSRFDLAGRVTKGVPAPTNLVVPPHYFVDVDTLVIGVDNA